jgi:hypothetical protein
MSKDVVFSSTRTSTLRGPALGREALHENYKPVSCDFTDELEAASVRGFSVEIAYWGNSNQASIVRGKIKDVFTEHSEDFLRMSGGEVIRLDRISQINIL